MIKIILGKINRKDAKIKFKNLKDTFRRLLNTESKLSNLRKNNADQWKFYDSMNFIKIYLLSDR